MSKIALPTRVAVYLLAALMIGASLLYSNYLARQLEEKEKQAAELYARAVFLMGRDAASPDDVISEAYDLSLNIIQEVGKDIPKAIIGEDQQVNFSNMPVPPNTTPEREAQLKYRWVEELRSEYPPVKVEFAPGRYNEVIYGQSPLLKQLRWFPLVQMLAALFFIGLVFANFVVALRGEQNKVWVGLAKETAHQLGTPVSSLMAWIELLKLRAEDRPEDKELIQEMESDVLRLENIAERFSKIGSQPELIEVGLKTVLDRSADYIQKRMTRGGRVRFRLDNEIPLDSKLHINPQLFDWVIENLLKNALDAIGDKGGEIVVHAGEKNNQIFIDVTDTGKGMPSNLHRKVFEPGFTTKKRGWGLGLSLSRRIIENYHKGKIFVKFSEPGKGTTFRISLPK